MATIKLIQSIEAFRDLRAEWESLVCQNVSARAFQRYDWNYIYWTTVHVKKHPQDSLFILRVTRDGHDELAIFPFYVSASGCLKFISAGYADYLDVICKAHTENWNGFYNDVAKYIRESSLIKTIQLDKLPSDSELLAYFGAFFPAAEIRRQYAYSFIGLKKANDISAAFSHLTSKERSYLRSLLKKSNGLKYRLFSRNAGDSCPVSDMKELRDRLVATGARTSAAVPDEMLDFIKDIYDLGLCELVALIDDCGRFLLLSTRLVNDGKVNFWLVMHSVSSLTSVADARYIDEKIKEGDCLFDWGIGAYSYKIGTFRPFVSNVFCLKVESFGLLQLCRAVKQLVKKYIKRVVLKRCV